MKCIVLCRCSGMEGQAEMAYKIAFPHREVPQIYRGQAAIADIAGRYYGTDFGKYVLAISKKNGRYAYYLEEEDGKVKIAYDLLKGKRVA